MKQPLPEELRSTWEMIERAFSGSPTCDEVSPLIRVLYEHIGDRQLAVIVAHILDQSAEVTINRVYEDASLPIDSDEVRAVKAKLTRAGFERWCLEE